MDYLTIMQPAEAEITERRSRFLAFASHAGSVGEAGRYLESIRQKHPGARHHVFACLLRDGTRRFSDDGEPQGTGGLPVLGVLERKDVVDVAVIVTRYFGGVLLGAPGLLRAYTTAAALALDGAQVIRMKLYEGYRMELDYPFFGRIERAVEALEGRIVKTDYGLRVKLEAQVPKERSGEFVKMIVNLTNGSVYPETTDEIYCQQD